LSYTYRAKKFTQFRTHDVLSGHSAQITLLKSEVEDECDFDQNWSILSKVTSTVYFIYLGQINIISTYSFKYHNF